MRTVAVTLGVLAAGWLALVLLAALFQRQLIYLPDAAAPDPPGDVEEVTLTTADGLELTAWFLAAGAAGGSRDGVGATVLVTPGNAGNRALRLPLARGLVDRGHDVLLLDYRGYGGNPGTPSEDALLADARAARRHLEQRDDVDPARLVYLGESIGTAVAAALASDAPPAALVLRSPFPELADVGRAAYPFLPVDTLLRERFRTLPHLERYDGPLLVVVGNADAIVPPELSHEVAEVADAEVVAVPGAGHNDLALLSGDRYLDAVDRFLRDAVEPRG